jgi:hypothetical protein
MKSWWIGLCGGVLLCAMAACDAGNRYYREHNLPDRYAIVEDPGRAPRAGKPSALSPLR